MARRDEKGSSRNRVGGFEAFFDSQCVRTGLRLAHPACSSESRVIFVTQRCGWIFGGMTSVSEIISETAPGGLHHQGPDAPSAHRRPGYPLSGCVPAEPDSVSPGSIRLALTE